MLAVYPPRNWIALRMQKTYIFEHLHLILHLLNENFLDTSFVARKIHDVPRHRTLYRLHSNFHNTMEVTNRLRMCYHISTMIDCMEWKTYLEHGEDFHRYIFVTDSYLFLSTHKDASGKDPVGSYWWLEDLLSVSKMIDKLIFW